MPHGQQIHVVASVKPDVLSVEELGHLPKGIFGGHLLGADHHPQAMLGGAPEPTVTPNDAQYDNDVNAGFKTVFVVGLNDSDKAQTAPIADNVQSFLTYLTGLTNSKLAEKIASKAIGADDYAKQSDYRARLMAALVLNTQGFLALDADVGFTHQFECKALELHTELLAALFKGLSVPTQVFSAFEGIFTSLKDTVIKLSSTSTVDTKHIFLIVKSFVKNDLGLVETHLRFFLFKLTDSVRQVAIGKSNYSSVKIDIDFQNTQYTWNNQVYNRVKDSMDAKLTEAGKAAMDKFASVDVDI